MGIADDDTWFSFVATQTNHSIVLSSVTYDMVTEVFSGSCGSLTQLVCSDPDITSLTGLTIGDTYYFRCYSKADGLRNTFNLCVTAPPPPPSNDECSGAINLTVNPATTCTTVTNGSTSGATQSQSACLGSGADDDVWFSFVATSTSHLIDLLNVSGSTDMLHQVFSGTCGSLTSLTCSDPNSSTTSGLTIGSTYYVRVHTYYTGSSASFDICVKTPPPPPKTWVGGTGDWGVAANWSPSGVPTCTDSVNINTGTITLNGANAECRGFIISSGTLNLNSGSLTIGVCGATDGGSKYFVQSGGTINLSGATVTLNGGFTQSAGTFTFSSGTFTIDPNGTAGVYSNTNSCNIAGTFNMSGGNLILPDASSSSGTVIYYNGTTNRNFTGGTVSIGGGNSSNTLNINTYVGSYRLAFYNLEINTSTNNTYANSSSWSFGVLNNLNIASGELRTSVAIYVNGNLNNDGIFTNSSTLYLANFTSGSATASTLAQEISGGGIYRNSTTKTAEFTTLNINNTNTSGVTFNISDPSVSGTLTLTAGKIFGQSSNQFVLWAKSSIIYTNGWVVGKLKRTISSSGATVFYIGTASTYYPVTTNFTSNPAGTLTASFEAGAPGSTGLPLTEVSGTNPYLSADSLWSAGVWRLTTADITSTTYSISVTATGSSQNGNNANVRVIKRADNGSSWDNPGTHVNGSGIVYSRSGLSGFSEFTIVRGALLPLPLELTSINAKSINKSNKITWTTANEKNTAWHQIERANDELAEFKPIGKIAAAGNSLSSLDYSFMDENPLFMSYYRVRTIDLDGKESISPVVSVERAVERFSIEKLYPNPTNNLLNIDIQSLNLKSLL
ncbi:MAG: hypothetical protein IPL95_12755 [Saprospiraceae bacterium]|nr:hypothetical protein [Saprospiraceae bacterium]